MSGAGASPAISARLCDFAGFLRANELAIDPGRLVDMHRVAALGALAAPERLRAGLRCCLCVERSQWQRFDALFDAFWFPSTVEPGDADGDDPGPVPRTAAGGDNRVIGLGGSSEIKAARETVVGAGDFKALSLADFRFVFDRREMVAIERFVRLLARRARRRQLRRHRIASKGRTIDLRQSVRRRLRADRADALAYRRARRRLPALVLLIDVSQSMDVYTRLFLRFVRELLVVFERSEAFTFTTDLAPLASGSRRLTENDLETALNRSSDGWLGGTRIAHSLGRFNREHARRTVDRRTTVVVFSDGHDTDARASLIPEIATLSRRARKLVWINPLLGRFAPGEADPRMDPIVPWLDAYRSAHSLAALEALEHDLLS